MIKFLVCMFVIGPIIFAIWFFDTVTDDSNFWDSPIWWKILCGLFIVGAIASGLERSD